MRDKQISNNRRRYLRKILLNKIAIITTQITIIIIFIVLWEVLANNKIIDNFITSQPSRIMKTFMNLSNNGLLEHLGVTCFETIVGFVSGTLLGIIIAVILWWSDFLSKVAEPFLVVLNSLPKIALRTCNNNMGWGRNASNNCYGTCNIINCNYFRNIKWIYKYRSRKN